MNRHRPPRNPSSFSDALTKNYYAKKLATRKMLNRDREKRVDWLRKKAKHNERAQALADKLETCRPKRRCKSGACPQCAHAAQRLFARTTRRHLKGKVRVVCVSIVPANDTLNPGSLSLSEQERFVRRNKEKIGRAHEGFFIGAVDWTLNEHLQQKHQPYWCPHIHGITTTKNLKRLRRKLKRQFPRSDLIFRPITVREWDEHFAALRYPFKSRFQRRISTDKGERFDKRTGENRKCRDTDSQPLRSRHRLELLLHLDAIGIAGQLLLRRLQFMNLRDTGPTFVDPLSRVRHRRNEKKDESDW
jgi:hypothetical protein